MHIPQRMHSVWLADAAIQEARERVRAALRAAGFSMPGEKIVVNLAPSHLRKTGSGFDLPIALGILAATGQIDPAWARDALYVGELSLDGRVRPVAGTLACAICARRLGLDFVCAADSDPVPLDDQDQCSSASVHKILIFAFPYERVCTPLHNIYSTPHRHAQT